MAAHSFPQAAALFGVFVMPFSDNISASPDLP
jgi:hypothetical protein